MLDITSIYDIFAFSFGNIPYWRCKIRSSIIIIFNISLEVWDAFSRWSYKTNWRAHQPFPISELSLMIYCNSCFPQNCEKSSNCQNNHNIVQKTFWHFLWFSTLLAYYIIRFIRFENGSHQEKNLPELVIQQFILKLPWQMVTFLLYPKRFSTLKIFYFTLIFFWTCRSR